MHYFGEHEATAREKREQRRKAFPLRTSVNSVTVTDSGPRQEPGCAALAHKGKILPRTVVWNSLPQDLPYHAGGSLAEQLR